MAQITPPSGQRPLARRLARISSAHRGSATAASSRGRGGRPRQREAHGFTIVEMTVAMAVMSILTVLVMSGMNHILNSDMQTEAVRNSSDQVDFAFLTLDSEVRYASAVWAVNQVTTGGHTDYNVEFETQSNVTTSTTPNCTELQYNYATGQLLQATWPDTQTSSSTAPGFEVLASGLSTSVSASPFTINPVTSNYKKVQLMVTLSATAGTGTAHETASSSVTFTAVNTTSTAVAVTADCDPTGWGY